MFDKLYLEPSRNGFSARSILGSWQSRSQHLYLNVQEQVNVSPRFQDLSLTFYRQFVHYAGLILATFSVIWTLYLIIRTQPWSDMIYPLPELKMARFGKFANRMGHLSYASLAIFIIWALIGHLFDELAPVSFTYVDSLGPPVNFSVFNSTPGSTAWDQSHDSNRADAYFLGGNSTSWSDCFDITPSKSASGHISEWWRERESKALRVLAQL